VPAQQVQAQAAAGEQVRPVPVQARLVLPQDVEPEAAGEH
jgi:hypothetical protein